MSEDLLAEFSPPVPYTRESIAQAPHAPGVHVVLDGGEVIYVGHTGNLRERMGQHLQGGRGSSILHKKVGRLLDGDGRVATRDEIAQWLNGRSVRWRETDDHEALKADLVDAFRPRFSSITTRPTDGVASSGGDELARTPTPGRGEPPAGFDRPYRGKPAEGDYPHVQATSPAARERAAAEHDALCRQLIAHLAAGEIEAGELNVPPVDIAWRDRRGRQVIAEVKSCFDGNDTDQLRLGLGQIPGYRHRLATAGVTADAILLGSRVKDPLWYEICRGVDVRLLAGDDEASWELAI